MTLPTDPHWHYFEAAFDPASAAFRESLFAVGNGYLGVRGYLDEGYPDGTQNTCAAAYINGVYESLPIEYDESAFGFAKNNHRMVPLPHPHWHIWLNNTRFHLSHGTVTEHKRSLSFRDGCYRRVVTWQGPQGDQWQLTFERMADVHNPHLIHNRVQVQSLSGGGHARIRFCLDPSNSAINDVDDPRKGGTVPAENWRQEKQETNAFFAGLQFRTANSDIGVGCGFTSVCPATVIPGADDGGVWHESHHGLAAGDQATVVTHLAYYDDRFETNLDLLEKAKAAAENATRVPFDGWLSQQTQRLDEFWTSADIEIDSDDDAQYATRFSLFHLFQSTGRDGRSSIAAKGLTGAGYDGHYFWDSETYIFPFWLFSEPEVAKSLLAYRVQTLDAARQRARQMGHASGALFAWRTIGGEECSSYFPAGSAQYHINADIAYAARSYWLATKDSEFLKQGLAALVFETARIWSGLGHFTAENQFELFDVTGPDEYTAIVNNNFYTNKMAQVHLQFAFDLAQELQANDPGYWAALSAELSLCVNEQTAWQRMASAMHLPFDADKNIYAQDDSFLHKPRWDFDNTPADKYPLLLHFHPLVIYRHQVLKQADTLLALLLAGHDVPADIKADSYHYYEAINTHDSTLSTCVHGVLANEIGRHEDAYRYYATTMKLDLDDSHHNTYYGVHTAAMGGIWMGAIQGFAGLRYDRGELHFNPRLPDRWRKLGFALAWQGRRLQLELTAKQLSIVVLDGEPLTVFINGQSTLVEVDQPTDVSLT